MLIAALAAALLAVQAPAAAAPPADAPAAAVDAPPPAAADGPTATAPSAAAAAEESDTPSGAPKDDFGFVNWCKGALTGHMELYPQVKPELAQVEVERAAAEDPKLNPAQLKLAKAQRARDAVEEEKGDQAQAAAGRDYLALYDRAIAAAERSGGEDLRLKAEDDKAQGYRVFSAARAAPARTKMWSWLVWELPARCETAARKLESQSDLLGAALKGGDVAAPAAAAAAPDLRPPEAAPAAADPADPGTQAAPPAASPQ